MGENNIDIERIIAEEERKEKERLAIVLRHIEEGVNFIDWKYAYIGNEVRIGIGTTIGPGVIIEGDTSIGKNCFIGHNTRIADSTIGDGVEIQSSVVLESNVGEGTKIGPFAYLRPNNHIGKNVKVGDFVEIKNSTMGDGAKASHLTYIGDADVGDDVNLGCGVVFVNYNGSEKHRSTVGAGAFIGCNANLISPVTVGEGAYIAAGTTVTKNVPPGSLCIGRAENRIIPDWVEKRGILKRKK